MKRMNASIILGVVLILGGVLALLQSMGILSNVGDLFWGSAFLIAGALFLYAFATGSWWGAIPGFTLAGLGVLILLPPSLDFFGGAIFLGGVALAFWAVYLTGRQERWWALIPAGVLTTLAVITLAPRLMADEATGGIFFFGLALTFLLVALLANMRWAYYPAVALGVLGLLISLSVASFANYIWAAAMILGGLFLLFRYFRKTNEL